MVLKSNMELIPLFSTPYKKLKKVKAFGFVAECDCGHKHRFRGDDIDIENSDSSIAMLKKLYFCPNCDDVYNGIFEEISDRNVWYRNLSPIGVLISLMLIFGFSYGGYKVFNFLTSSNTNDYKNATNRELQDFQKWDQKQKQKELEKSPAFNNSN